MGKPCPVSDDVPLLLVANHVSWWDGFLLREVQRELRPQSVLYTLALERELREHPVLRLTGGIGVDPASPASILGAVRRFEHKRQEFPHAVFAYFPQGSIAPSYKRPLAFRRGVELFARAIAPLTVLPVA
ncbi:MAG: 1-acyl-sn-glycerol-3-phosphate acyltransferase, partial [Gemmatimonadaceae bacterium]